MKFRYLILISLWPYSVFVYSQSETIDSLRRLVEESEDIDLKIEALSQLSNQFQNPNDKLIYSRQAFQLSEGASAKSKIVASNKMGISHGMLGQLDSSEFYFSKALEASIELGDSTYISSSYNGLGNISRMQGKLENALSSFLKALDYSDAVGNDQWPADILTNISGVYFDLKNFDAALEKVLEARTLYEALGDQINLSYTANLLAILYRGMGELDKSYQYNQEALEILLIIKDTSQIIYNYVNSTEILIEQNKLNEAAASAIKTIELTDQFGDRDPQITSLLTLSSIYFRQGKVALANKYVNQGIALAEKHNFRAQLPNAYMIKSLIEASKGNLAKSYKLMELHRSWTDSIRSQEIADRISELNVQYDTEKKEREIERLNAEQEIKDLQLAQAQTRNIFLSILAIFFVTVFAIIWYLYRQRTRINKQLKAANHTKDKLFSMIAHDIKNPLSAFKAIANALEENYKSMEKDQVELLISQLDSSSNKLLDLLQNLLEWSISESGNLRFNPEQISLKSVADEAIGLFQGVVEMKGLKVQNEILPNDQVVADYKMLFSVIRNLISNAVKFTPNGGTISIKSNRNGNLLEVSVADTGYGMSDEQAKNIFNKNSPTSKEGTGLGLVLCKEFVEKNGGYIQVQSEKGAGTTFKFTLRTAA